MIKMEDIYDAFKVSYHLLIKRLAFFITLTLIFVAISQIANLIALNLEHSDTASAILTPEKFPTIPPESLPRVTPKSLFVRLIGTGISLALMIGIIKISLKTLRGEKTEISLLFDSSDKFLKVLAGGVLATCIAFAPPMLFAILMRFIPTSHAIDSIVMIAILIAMIIRTERLRFFIYFIVDRNSSPFESIKQSRKITNGNIKMLLLFDAICALINILGFEILFVGLLFTFPLTAIAKAHLYKKLSGAIEETVNIDNENVDMQASDN